jgi:hypothetical protein
MNKDSHLIFEVYKNKKAAVLNEGPVAFEPEYKGSGEEVKAEFPELAAGKYALTPEQTALVFSKFVEKFKSMGGNSPKLYKDFYETEIGPLVREANPSINNTNAKYASRVLYNALKAAKVVKDERDGVEGVKKAKGLPTQAGVQKLAQITAANPERFEGEGEEVASSESKAPEAPQDAATTRIANWVFDEIDPVVGAPEQDVISSVQRKIMSSGGLGMEEKSIVSKIKGVISILAGSKVLEKKAGKLIFGSNFEKFEDASGDTSNIGKDPLEIAQELGYMGSPEHQRFGQGKNFWEKQS